MAASIDDNAADGNLDKRKVRLIRVGYISYRKSWVCAAGVLCFLLNHCELVACFEELMKEYWDLVWYNRQKKI